MNKRRHLKNQASALLTALFVTAIAAILSVAIISRLSLLIHLSELSTVSDQGYLYLQGLRDQFESDIIKYAAAWQKPSTAGSSLQLPQRIGPQKFQGSVLYGRLQDQQGLFNINELTSVNNQTCFIALLKTLFPDIKKNRAIQLTQAVTEWVTPNTSADQIYDKLKPPYRAAHQPMVDISELHLVAGFTPAIYKRISPYLSALPVATGKQTLININTALAPVLTTLSPTITIEKAIALFSCRKQHGEFLSVSDYNKTCVHPLGLPDLTGITTHSNYFMVSSSASNEDQQIFLRSLIMVFNGPDNRQGIQIIWQQFN